MQLAYNASNTVANSLLENIESFIEPFLRGSESGIQFSLAIVYLTEIGKITKNTRIIDIICSFLQHGNIEREKIIHEALVKLSFLLTNKQIFQLISEANLGIGSIYDCIENASITSGLENNSTSINQSTQFDYKVSLRSIQQALERLNKGV